MPQADGYRGTDNLEVMASAVHYNAFLLDQVLKARGTAGTVVDFGAGLGTFSEAVRSRGVAVTCIEADRSLAQKLRDRGFEVHTDLDQLPSGQAEFVFSLNVLEHIADDVAVLRQLYRCLRPGGQLYLFVPAFNVLFSSMDTKVGHHRRYTRASLLPPLRQVGFRVDRAAYVDTLGFFASLIYRATSDRTGSINEKALLIYDRGFFRISRILDRFCHRWFGKNLVVLASRPT